MIGIYFSGTGNSRYCEEKFLKEFGEGFKMYSIEDEKAVSAIKENDTIILAYPVYYSNIPKILSDFIDNNSELWKYKKVFIIATMGLFSGDGAGVSARILKKYDAKIIGGLHLKMPDCIGDVKVLKKSLEANKKIVKQAETKIKIAAERFKAGKPPKEGLGILYHFAGFFGQRMFFKNKTKKYSDKLKINSEKCSGCGKCQKLCPMGNLTISKEQAVSENLCTMCYRCVNNCPRQAITLIGKRVVEQCLIHKYI